MKILHTENSCGWGGQEIRILTESKGLMERGHEVAIVCPTQAPIHEAAREAGLITLAADIRRKNIPGLAAMYRALKSWQPDVINTHSSTDSWLSALAVRLGASDAPIVRTRHISAPVSPSLTNRWLYGSAARHVVTTGTRIRDELVQKGLVKSENCQSIHTGIDASIFSPGDRIDARRALSLNPSGFYLGIAATIRSWKGHAYLIEALSTLPTHVELLIIGKGPYQETVESRVRDLGLENRVHFVGHQTRVAEWLRALDIFVLPSYANEGVPQSLMQAMLCRIPVVSTPVGSIEDIIRPESTGLLVPPKNSQALAQALDRLIRDDTLRDKLAEEGYRFARETCTLSSMVEQMERVFQKVVSA